MSKIRNFFSKYGMITTIVVFLMFLMQTCSKSSVKHQKNDILGKYDSTKNIITAYVKKDSINSDGCYRKDVCLTDIKNYLDSCKNHPRSYEIIKHDAEIYNIFKKHSVK